METATLSVARIANLLGLSPTSVRRYADSLAHLSEGASSRPRSFTDDDVARLQIAAQVKASRVAAQAIS